MEDIAIFINMKTDTIPVKRKGRKPSNSAAFARIAAVKKGQSIIVTRPEWHIKTVPGQHIIRRHTGREFKVETLADDSGWRVTALD